MPSSLRICAPHNYVPEVADLLPPTRPAALIRIPAEAFKSKATLRAFLRANPNADRSNLATILSAALVAAAGSDGAPLKAKKRTRTEGAMQRQVEEANLPQFKPVTKIRTTRAGKPVKTYPKFHWN